MKKLFRNALLVGSLLLSSTASGHVDHEFSAIISGLAPTLPVQEKDALYSPREDAKSAPASKYLAHHPFNMKTVKKVAGSNPVFTLDTLHEATDGAYILLHQNDLKSAEAMHALQSILQKPTDVHVILDVEADSAGVLNLYSAVKKEHSDGSITRHRSLPFIKHLHLINSAQNVKTICQGFLYGDNYLENITFTGFETVEHIADNFMLLCPKLQSADLSSFENLKTIGNFFMSASKSLTTLKFHTTRFFNADLTSVGDHFLRGATSLARIQEDALESVIHIGNYFMMDSGVERFNTNKFKKLKELGKGFLFRCSSLAYVNVSGLKSIEPALVTLAEAEAAETAAEKARLQLHTNFKSAWKDSVEAQNATETADAATNVALSHFNTTKAISAAGGKVLKRALHTKELLQTAKVATASAAALDAKADHQVELAEKALQHHKALKVTAESLLKAAHNKQRTSLGLLLDCPKLKENPTAIRGAWDLLKPLQDQLHMAYPGLTYEDDTCGC